MRNIIPQKRQPDEVPEYCPDVACPPHTSRPYRLTLLGLAQKIWPTGSDQDVTGFETCTYEGMKTAIDAARLSLMFNR
jgi:hypothetical protein